MSAPINNAKINVIRALGMAEKPLTLPEIATLNRVLREAARNSLFSLVDSGHVKPSEDVLNAFELTELGEELSKEHPTPDSVKSLRMQRAS